MFSYPNIYPVINKSRLQLMQQKVSTFFSTFESIYLKYLKFIQSGRRFELRISNDMWPHVFRSKVVLYIFIFFVTYLVYIFFSSYVAIVHLLWRRLCVGIYCKLINDWIQLTRARILFPAHYKTGIQNQILNTTRRIISKEHRVIRQKESLYLDYLIETASWVFSPRVFPIPYHPIYQTYSTQITCWTHWFHYNRGSCTTK